MTFATTLSRAMPAFHRTGEGTGTITVDHDVATVSLPRWGKVNARFAMPRTGAWLALPRWEPAAPSDDAPQLQYGRHFVHTSDEAFGRAWIDEPILEALAGPTDSATFVLHDGRLDLRVPGFVAPFYLRDPLWIGAVIATRSFRLARELAATMSFLSPVVHGAQWGVDGGFTIVIARHGVDVVIDWVRIAARVRTRARITIAERARTRDALLDGHDRKVAALGDAWVERDLHHLLVLREGIVPTREHLDSTLDLLFAIGVSERGSTGFGTYR